uniref:3D domain protein n=1 Tax=Solibacter usitatus (strain Ellin6076) TaxID=234267 RepID=Q01WM9_SOLUE
MKIRAILACTAMLMCSSLQAQTRRHRHPARAFEATAYAQRDVTASGKISRSGLVAADPAVLPLGSKIHVTNAGAYSGVYTVADTGSKVQGRHIDIFIHGAARAKAFGKKTVLVRVLRRGPPPNENDSTR